MQLPHLQKPDRPTIPTGTDQWDGDIGKGGFDQPVEQVFGPGANGPEGHHGRGTAGRVRVELDGAFDDFDRALEIDPEDCVAYISRGNARFYKGDPNCEADYRTAFSLDAPLAALEFVRRLKFDIGYDLANVLRHCRERLKADSQDVVARARLGLTLLMLYEDDDGLRELQQVFLQSAPWRPLLRLLVNEAKRRRATLLAQVLRAP
jgi:hypothetical protein